MSPDSLAPLKMQRNNSSFGGRRSRQSWLVYINSLVMNFRITKKYFRMFKIFSRVTPPRLKALRKNMLKETGFGLVDWNYGRRWLRESRRVGLLRSLQRNHQRNLQRNHQRNLQKNLQRNLQKNRRRNLHHRIFRNNFSLSNSVFEQCNI